MDLWWFGLAMVLSIVWPRIYCCVLFVRNCLFERTCSWLFSKQIIRVFLSVYTCRKLTWRNLEASEFSFLPKSTKKKSLIEAFLIFHNNSCLLELRMVLYQATEYATLLRYNIPGLSQVIILIVVTLVSHCFKSFLAFYSPRFSIDVNYPWEIHTL